jgi:hypothetical protein
LSFFEVELLGTCGQVCCCHYHDFRLLRFSLLSMTNGNQK